MQLRWHEKEPLQSEFKPFGLTCRLSTMILYMLEGMREREKAHTGFASS